MDKIGEEKKEARNKLSKFQQAAQNGENTVGIETQIEQDIKNLKQKHSQLDNASSHIPGAELDRRQKEIQQLHIDIQGIEKSFKNLQTQKYAFKGQNDGQYQQTEEMKTMSNSELMQYQKQKIKNQDQQIDEITLDVKI